MSTEAQQLFDKWKGAWEAKDVEGVLKNYTDDAKMSLITSNMHNVDKSTFRSMLPGLFGLPDLKRDFKSVNGNRNFVVLEQVMSFTHSSPNPVVPVESKGQTVHMALVSLFWVNEEGLIYKCNDYMGVIEP